MQDQFADVIGNASLASGVVRIDFMRMAVCILRISCLIT